MKNDHFALVDARRGTECRRWGDVRDVDRPRSASGPTIAMDFPDATCLGLWTKPAARFICIEPWRGVADPFDFEGEFAAKPGIFQVAPGAREALTMHMTIQE